MPEQTNAVSSREIAREFWPETGVWVAFYSDRSGCVPFGSEIEALRYAVDKSMTVRIVPFGEDVFS